MVTVAEILALTGETVTEANISLAETLILMHIGVAPSKVTELSQADQELLKSAVAWQAVFIAKSPDLLSRDRTIASVSVAGISISYRDGGDVPWWLSPLAARGLGWLSWLKPVDTTFGIKTVRVQRQCYQSQHELNRWGRPVDWWKTL